jgi:hypothetical protein
MRKLLSLLLVALVPALPVWATGLPAAKVEHVRTGLTIGGALVGLAVTAPNVVGLLPPGTPLSNTLLVAIPATAVAAALGAVAGRWIADTTIALRPSLLASPFLGAGLGLVGGAVVGGIGFALAFAIAMPTVDAPAGYWGFEYPQALGMAFLAGGVWGGIFGVPTGAVVVPILSVYLGF